MTDPLDLAYRLAIEDRIRELQRWRKWYRDQPNPEWWADLAAEHEAELRSLLRLKRLARSVARTVRAQEAALLADGEFYAGMPA